tara:strand:+ start:706808 stop:707749 length:942 start_codon:yes stop_codon:yes gene_type:complete
MTSNTKMEPDSTVYKTLLESTKAIPWKIDWKSMSFSYIGPQIEPLLGWTPESWVSANDWAERMHPEDRDWVVNFCITQSKEGVDHEADYRALTKDGNYVWVRDVVHVVRDDKGEVDSLIGFMFDISERKKTEARLADMQTELEALSFKDGLTGIANRRMLDTILEQEWNHARRSSQPLAIIMLDIDYFKQYNDHYGHIQGDECLKRVAQALSGAGTRPRDFFARFGGEEFMLILPATDEQSAINVANRCRDLIFKEQIPHAKSAVSQLLTISMGVSAIIPGNQHVLLTFIEEADKRLYQAKEQGRNRIVGACA